MSFVSSQFVHRVADTLVEFPVVIDGNTRVVNDDADDILSIDVDAFNVRGDVKRVAYGVGDRFHHILGVLDADLSAVVPDPYGICPAVEGGECAYALEPSLSQTSFH